MLIEVQRSFCLSKAGTAGTWGENCFCGPEMSLLNYLIRCGCLSHKLSHYRWPCNFYRESSSTRSVMLLCYMLSEDSYCESHLGIHMYYCLAQEKNPLQ